MIPLSVSLVSEVINRLWIGEREIGTKNERGRK